MAYDGVVVANTMLNMAWEKNVPQMTPMKLQKLLFIAHSFYFKKYKKPLISDHFYKWRFGPVLKDVYREFASYGSFEIDSLASDAKGNVYVIPHDHLKSREMIEAVLDVFGTLTPWTLSDLSHKQGTAWDLTENDGIIKDEDIENAPVYSN